MALFNEWQAQRQQRQQELRSRQQQVSQDLADFRQNRADMGRAMRQSLSDYHGQIKRETQALSQKTQIFLTDCQDRRIQDTQALMQALDNFYQTLAADTAQFLNHVTQDRVTMATQQTKELQDFHDYLNTSVSQFLQESYHDRMDMKAELTDYLHNFINQLCSDVAAYLQELDLQRQQMAEDLQEMFQTDRDGRSQTMQGLYNHFANLRLQRQQDLETLQTEMWRNVKEYRANLFNQVWGTLPTAKVSSTPAKSPSPVSQARDTVSSSVGSPLSEAAAAPIPQNIDSSDSSLEKGGGGDISQTPSPQTPSPQTPSPAIAASPPSPPTQTQPEPQPSPAPPTPESSSAMMQKAVYDYIQEVKSARLKDIEENLNINRIQTVDILKALMAKGLITQNNRDYMLVETK